MQRTFIPGKLLQPFVRKITIEESHNVVYKVLPVPGLVMGFQYSGTLFSVEGAKTEQLQNAGITGFPTHWRLFKTAPDTGTVLVHFRETAAGMFFREPLHEISGKSIPLDQLIPFVHLKEVEDKLSEARSDVARANIVESFLVSRLQPRLNDALIGEAVRQIYLNGGVVRIGELAKNLNLSKSPFEKRFRKTTGTSPKKFASVVQFQNALSLFDPGRSLTELSLAAGYFDQSHFIRHFRSMTGESPDRFFAATKK